MERVALLIAAKITGPVRTNVPLADHTSFRIGGPADLYVEPQTPAELTSLLVLLKQEGIPYFILGNGTNLLVKDEGFRGAVIRLGGEFSRFCYDGHTLHSGGGVSLSLLANDACKKGFGNLVFATGIPGTLGGALFMNAGAHGYTVGDFLIDAVILNHDLRLHTCEWQELGLSYRKSAIKPGSVICSARLRLELGNCEEVEHKCREVRTFRREKQPCQPNAGSIFKNPPEDSAGRLLEASGLKGFRKGGAMISDVHANFIVNMGNATAKDVLSLAETARSVVREKFGVDLEMEIKVLGE